MSWLRRIVALALPAILLVGCSAPEAEVPSVPLISHEPGVAVDLSLPFDRYELSPEGGVQVSRALYKLIEKCMAGFGLRLDVPQASPLKYPVHATQLYWQGMYDVREFGYVGPPGFADDMSAAARRGRRHLLIPAEQTAVYFGQTASHGALAVPTGGCDGAAEREINGTAERPVLAAVDPTVEPHLTFEWFESQAADRAMADARYRSVLRAWSECMARDGHHYRDPDAAASDPRWNARGAQPSTPPSSEEVAVVVTDRACRTETNLTGVLRYLIAEFENDILAEHGSDVETASVLLRTRARNAARVLDTSPID
ncbi:hypothetical protein [Micromonospora sp. NPDC005197]|uniref:hypothetical protein n=1 Tax=Micromonospora sp. NPDC005197 TaxID=3157020 RepID=UPI0033A98B5B